MPAHRGRRNGRFGRFLVAGAVACVVAPIAGEVVAVAAPTAAPVSGDPRATAYPGNIHDGKSGNACSQLGFADDTEVAVDGSGGYAVGDYDITSDGSNLTVSAIPADTQIDALVVKGGDAYNVYPAAAFTSLPGTAVTGLHAPMVGVNQDNVPTISHWFLCDGEPNEQPVVVPTTGDVTGNCTQAVVTIDAGSSDADVLIDPSGTGTAHHVTVTKDTESIVDVAVSAAHPTVTATDTASSTQLGTYTRSAQACDHGTSNQGGVDPKVSFGTSCAHGIQVVLSNMKLDDTTTDPVTFTIVTPAGSTEHVTVSADHIVKRYYDVAANTTGVVTVSAPGLAATSKSYTKKCTQVLGEKVTKTPAVQGEKVTRLPFTGLPVWAMLSVAAAMCLSGAIMTQAGRRRPAVTFATMPGVPTPGRRTYPSRGVIGR